jgi:hypothetical protein
MQKATLGQKKKLWRIVEQEGTPREQLQRVLASGLFSDLLKANFNEPIDRNEYRRVIGVKHPVLDLPIEALLDKCRDVRLYNAIVIRRYDGDVKTIGDLIDHIKRHPISQWKNAGGKTILVAKSTLREAFGIELPMTEKDQKWVEAYLLRAGRTTDDDLPAEEALFPSLLPK